MTATILTGSAGSGKTNWIIDAILDTEEDVFWEEIWVLLPTRLQGEVFRDRLIEQAQQRHQQTAMFNVRFFEFYELYDMLLDLTGSPQRTIMRAAGDQILRSVIDGLHRKNQFGYYDQIADKPGFVQLVSSFIRELKQGVVLPEVFSQIADERGPKDRDLALIYDGYQNFLLSNNLIDRDGAGWVALAQLRDHPQAAQHIRLLAIDGFDNFNPLQARLLAGLSKQVQETVLTLTYEDHRQDDACRVFHRTLERLKKTGDWNLQDHQVPDNLPHAAPLTYLKDQLFAINPKQKPAEQHLNLIEAPDPRAEVKAVLRTVKNLLLAGENPEDILIVTHQSDPYADALRSTATAYGLPVLVRQAERLMQNPAVRTILQLLDLHSLDFPRRQMLDLMHSPYLQTPDLTAQHIEELERLSMEKPIVRGRDRWLHGLVAPSLRDEDGDTGFQATDSLSLQAQTEKFFDRITPPEKATARHYIHWIEGLLGSDPQADSQDQAELPDVLYTSDYDHFNLYGQVRDDADPILIVRDIYALHGLRSALQDVVAAYDLLADTDLEGQEFGVQWETFRADLELAIKDRTISDKASRSRRGRVLATSVLEARGLPHQHVYILGMSEGLFPQRQNEDPLYSDNERDEFEGMGLDVETAAERVRDAGLFYETCGLALSSLTLSRPTVDDGGNPWTPSVFWKNVNEILDVEDSNFAKIPLGAAPRLDEAANLRELAISLGESLSRTPDEIRPSTWDAVRWIEVSPIWENIVHGRQIELSREAFGLPFDEYGGILQNERLIAEAASLLDENKIWSASQFNDLGQCAFRFFSKRILKLEPYEEPEEGLDALQLGSVNHKILEDTYQRIGDEGLHIHPENMERALEILDEEAHRILQTAPQEFGFQVTPFWEQEKANLLHKLDLLIRLDFPAENPVTKLSDNKDAPRQTLQQEAAFGVDGEPMLELHGIAGRLLARGFIDRLDLVGDDVIIIDYKSGSSTPSKGDMEEGRNFQMLLYLLAAEQLLSRRNLPYQIQGGLFWSIQSNKAGGAIRFDNPIVEEAKNLLQQGVQAAREGMFPNQPRKLVGGKCSHYCNFSQFCRVKRASMVKPLS